VKNDKEEEKIYNDMGEDTFQYLRCCSATLYDQSL